jgi:hypothetical protein
MSRQFALAIFWIAVSACAIAQLGILRSSVARSSTDENAQARGIPRSPRSVEILWTVLPALALAAILGATWLAIR